MHTSTYIYTGYSNTPITFNQYSFLFVIQMLFYLYLMQFKKCNIKRTKPTFQIKSSLEILKIESKITIRADYITHIA